MPGVNTFTMTCSGSGASGSASVDVEGYRNMEGIAADGYISGSEICVDENDDWICGDNEASTTSDNDGKFLIKYSNGNLLSIGGTDFDSQIQLDNFLISHALSGYTDFKVVTPITTIASFMESPSNINAALGIDSSIDITIFDPVANKGDGGINDFLYEKGNQLTVLAFALQNITNDLNSTTETTQDHFEAIAEEIEKEFTETSTKVDIETEAFVTKVTENIIQLKNLSLDADTKSNTIKALSGVMPVIQIKSTDTLTTSVIRFGISTFQTDIQTIANGTASSELLTSYTEDLLNYIATDQSIDADDIAPDISTVQDSVTIDEDTDINIDVLLNDSYVTSSPFTLTATNPTNGTINILSDIVKYSPELDYFGNDSFTYTLKQGDKTSSSNVNIVIEGINDKPTINIASTITVNEGDTEVGTVLTSDADEDELTLSITGTDADSFNLSDSNVITFKEAPVYATKSSYSITLSLTDGIETVTKDVTVLISNINKDGPIFTSQATFAANENQTAIGTVTATDSAGDDFSFTISGSELEITSAGVLTFISAPDYETKTSYTATVTATDVQNNSNSQDITVNVTDLNDNSPVITSNNTFSADENQTSVGTVTASDADQGDSVTFTISGNDLAITTSGVVTFISAPDYETQTSYTATVTASDGVNSSTQDLTVNVSNLNDNTPVITSNNTFSADENQTSVGTVTATDADGDSLTYSLSGTDASSLSISSSGVLTFNNAPDYETKNSYAVTVSVSDGSNSVSQDLTISINDKNDNSPVITSNNTFSADENQTSVGTVTATDADGSSLTYSLSGTDASSLSISSSGVLTFNSAPDYETKNSYSIIANVADETETTSQSITINIINLNDNVPVISSGASFNADENQTSVGTVSASDADGDSLSYSLSGTDAGSLAISNTGVITFNNAPDYEAKTSYSITAAVTDGATSVSQNITISIVNLNDNSPVISSGDTYNAAENQTAVGTVSASDADGDSITFSIGGTDASSFSISSSGVITFNSAPDYEVKNSYSINTSVSDGTNSVTQNITVNVVDVSEATVSGTAYTSRYTVLDTDIPNTDWFSSVSNNTVAAAQVVVNPSIISGYVGVNDTLDVYKISTSSSMIANLDVVDYVDNNKELRLQIYNSNGTDREWSYTSASVEENQTIVLPNGGDYLVVVSQLNGDSKYILTIGQRYDISSATASTDFIPDFIPNEFIAYRSEVLALNKSTQPIDEKAQKIVEDNKTKLSKITGESFDEFGVKSLVMPEQIENSHSTNSFLIDESSGLEQLSQKQITYLKHWSVLQELRSLSNEIIFDFQYQEELLAFTKDPSYGLQWNLERVQLEPALNAIGQDVKNVAVAVIDSGGPTPSSPAWNESNLIDGGFDFVYGDNNSIDYFATSSYTGNKASHGTHVSTTIALKNNNVGFNGYAVHALNINVFDQNPNRAQIIPNSTTNAVLYAAGLTNDSGLFAPNTIPIKVINLSLKQSGNVSYPTAYCQVMSDAISQGITVVAAAGNDQDTSPGLVSYPASCNGVVSVGATNSGGGIAFYSQQNSSVDISAPGGDPYDRNGDGLQDGIPAFQDDNLAEVLNGTSMAAPQASAAIALMYSVDSSMTPSRVNNMIAAGEMSDDRGATGKDNAFGYGELNVAKAIENVLEDISSDTTFAYTDVPYLNFATNTTQLNVSLNKVGTGSLSVTSLSADNTSGLTYNDGSANSDGFGTYTIFIDRSSLPQGEFSNTVYFNLSNNEKVAVKIYYNVGSLRSAPNIGKVYIAMYNASDNSLWGSLTTELDGSVGFTASNVAPGDYYILTSTDIDDNNTVCEFGELCQYYPPIGDQRSEFTVGSSNLSGYEIFVESRERYGGSQAASINAKPNNETGVNLYLQDSSMVGTGKISLTSPLLPNNIMLKGSKSFTEE